MRRVGKLLILVLLAAASLAPAARGAVEAPFNARFSVRGHAELASAANTLMTCPDEGGANAVCLSARGGSGLAGQLNNNNYAMERVDVDSDPATFDSSSADLALPPGATVDFAGVYYGARTSKGTGGAPASSPPSRGEVLFKAPGDPGYSALTATVFDSSAISAAYVGFVDVTSAVAAAGAGTYSVADVQTGTGQDRYAGWSLVVVYTDPSLPPASVTVFDGLATIQQGDPPLEIPISGLETPSAGAVEASVGIVAYEGERGTSGTPLKLDGQQLGDAANPINNVFNSTIADRGVKVAAKSPNYDNQLGFDADTLDASGILANGATAAQVSEATTLDQYLTQVVATSIELDPEALEPQVLPPAPPAPPSPEPETKSGEKHKKHGGEQPSPAKLDLEVSQPSSARPESVVPIQVTLRAEGGTAAKGAQACVRLPGSLRMLTAHGATRVSPGGACRRVAKLRPGTSMHLNVTAMVETTGSETIRDSASATASNAPARRRSYRLRVVPLRDTPCLLERVPIASASC